jgi:hypothetical protein
VNPGASDSQALRLAVSATHIKVVALLLTDPRVDPGAHDQSAIKTAALDGYLDMVKLLMTDPRVDPSFNNCLAVRNAARGTSKFSHRLTVFSWLSCCCRTITKGQ